MELEIAGFVWVVKKVGHLIESSQACVIIQTDYSAILDILQQSSITSMASIMRMNLRLIRASQFLHQFKLDVQYKSDKEHIVSDALNRLASTNGGCTDPSYFELDALFTYNTPSIKIYLSLVSKILASYEDDEHWAHIYCQVQANKDLGNNKALLLFVTKSSYKSDSNPYMSP